MAIAPRRQLVEYKNMRNGKIFNIFSLVRIGERSGMGLSSLYGVWEKEKFAEPSIVETYEPDRTMVTVEFEADEPEVIGKTSEVGEKTGVNDDVEPGSGHVKPTSGYVNRDFEVLMGAYRSDFRENARKVLHAFAESPEADISRVAKGLGFSAKSVWRAIRAMKEVGLLVREGGDKNGKWIVRKD